MIIVGIVVVNDTPGGRLYLTAREGDWWVPHAAPEAAWVHSAFPDATGWKCRPTGYFPARWSEKTGTQVTGKFAALAASPPATDVVGCESSTPHQDGDAAKAER